MHMADALISPEVAGLVYAASGGLLVYSSRKVATDPEFSQKLPLAGILGAFVFSSQMINFAIPGTGSSGHIGGGLLLAAILGPYATVLVMSSILLVQCLLFADGGLLALGCNIFNLAFWPAFVGLPVYLAIKKFGGSRAVHLAAAICAVIVSLEAGAFSVVLETALSGRSELPFPHFTALMLGIHLPIALVEGFLTYAVIGLLEQIAGARSAVDFAPQTASKGVYVCFIAIALLIAGVGSWFASSKPDGLEWSIFKITQAEELKEVDGAIQKLLRNIQEKTAILPDYSLPEDSEQKASAEDEPSQDSEIWPQPSAGTSLSGVIGGLVTALLVILVGTGLKRVKGAVSKAGA